MYEMNENRILIGEYQMANKRKLNKEERVKEVARMLSGASLTGASIANAKELLKTKR